MKVALVLSLWATQLFFSAADVSAQAFGEYGRAVGSVPHGRGITGPGPSSGLSQGSVSGGGVGDVAAPALGVEAPAVEGAMDQLALDGAAGDVGLARRRAGPGGPDPGVLRRDHDALDAEMYPYTDDERRNQDGQGNEPVVFEHQHERVEGRGVLGQSLAFIEGKERHVAAGRLPEDSTRDALSGRRDERLQRQYFAW